MYSCIIPDETGVEQTLHFGLYDYGYTSSEGFLCVELAECVWPVMAGFIPGIF